MQTSWRVIVTASITAVAATAALAVAVEAAPAPASSRPSPTAAGPASAPRRTAGSPHAHVASLPPVTEHALAPEVVAASDAQGASDAGQSVTEVVQLTIVGGELELVTDRATVVLERVPGSDRDWAGMLPPVRVIDARGTHEGWSVRWTVTELEVAATGRSGHVPAAKVHLDPQAPAVVAGLADGLITGHAGPAVRSGRVLFGAEPGAGGGTYEAGATVGLRLPSSLEADQVVVELAFTLD